MPEDYGALVLRLARLERQNRVVKAMASGAAGLVCATLLVGTARGTRPTLEAERFSLVGSDGRVCAAWETCAQAGTRTSQPRFAIFDAEGTARAALSLAPDGMPSFALSGPGGVDRLAIRLLPSGVPSISLYDGGGKTRATFSMMPISECPRAGFYDERGRAYWQAP